MNKSELIKTYKSLNRGEALILVTEFENYMMISESTLVNNNGFMELSDYNNDLTIYNEDFSINKIYKCCLTAGFDYVVNNLYCYKLIWERPQFIELTMDQIANKFGIDVNQLKIKK